MNLFETVKTAVTVRQAAEHCGLEVNRHGMPCCPFQADRHPSMKLNEGSFCCFGCEATGDVTDFVTRLFDLTSLQAAQKLAYGFDIDPDKPPLQGAARQCENVRCVPYGVPFAHWRYLENTAAPFYKDCPFPAKPAALLLVQLMIFARGRFHPAFFLPGLTRFLENRQPIRGRIMTIL